MASLESKSNCFNIVINEKAPMELDAILAKLTTLDLFTFYAMIIHDKDTLDNGKPKTRHLHLYCEKSSQIALKTQLNELCKVLNVEQNQISIDKANNNYLPIQYLTHKNDKSKYQYGYDYIVSNNYEELKERYNKVYVKPLTEEEISEFLMTDLTIADLIKHIGLGNTKKYLSVFKELQKDPNQAKQTEWIMSTMCDYRDCIEELYLLILSKTGLTAKQQADKILEKYDIKIEP